MGASTKGPSSQGRTRQAPSGQKPSVYSACTSAVRSQTKHAPTEYNLTPLPGDGLLTSQSLRTDHCGDAIPRAPSPSLGEPFPKVRRSVRCSGCHVRPEAIACNHIRKMAKTCPAWRRSMAQQMFHTLPPPPAQNKGGGGNQAGEAGKARGKTTSTHEGSEADRHAGTAGHLIQELPLVLELPLTLYRDCHSPCTATATHLEQELVGWQGAPSQHVRCILMSQHPVRRLLEQCLAGILPPHLLWEQHQRIGTRK